MKAERDRLHIEEFAASFANELHEITSEIDHLRIEEQDLNGQRDWFQGLAARLDDELHLRQEQLRSLSEQRDRLQEEINGLRVDLATTEERREALRNHISHLRRNLQDIEDQREERQRRIASHGEQRTSLLEVLSENEAQHTEMAEKVEEF